MDNRIVLLLMVFVLSSPLPARATNIDIDASVEYQTIDNFGASDCWSMQKIGVWFPAQKERVADLLFSEDNGIGLSAWRFNLGAGINTATIHHPWRTVETFEVSQGVYDWSRQEEERWFLQAAKERGVEQFIAFVNSPPARMTRNGYTNCSDGLGSTNLTSGYEGQFATYLVDILKHFRDEWDISFDFVSPVNEPQWEWNGSNQEGNRAGNEDIRAIVNALYDELQNQALETEISIVESGDLRSWYQENGGMTSEYGQTYCNYLAELLADENIRTKIGLHFGGHSYWSDRLANQLVEDRQELFFRILPYLNNGWKYWMTEYCILDGPLGHGGHGRDLTINTALDVARVIHYDLTALRASAWQWWTAVSPEDYKDGLIYTDYMTDPGSQSIIESKLLWAFGNYSRYIRPGSVRVELSGANDKIGLMGSAYMSPDGDKLIIVFVNVGNSEESVSLAVSGLDSDQEILVYTPYVTSDTAGDNLKEYPAFPADSAYIIPARAVVTLIGQINGPGGFPGIDLNELPGFDPNDYYLAQNYPNPFKQGTQIIYYLPQAEKIRISIYSLLGQRIKTLVNDEQIAGADWISWDGTNSKNDVVSSGVYFYSLQVAGQRDTKKMLFIQ